MAGQETQVQALRGTPSSVDARVAGGTTDAAMFVQLKARLTDKLEQLSWQLMRNVERRLAATGRRRSGDGEEAERLQQRIRLFGQLASGLVDV
ncbi:MAG: hypothetical protein ACRELX_18120, partial [Longimicrobiales bacterium]